MDIFCLSGVIKNGGVKPNIIPSYSELQFYLRAPSRKDLAELQEKASACFNAAATATACKVSQLVQQLINMSESFIFL